MYKSTKVYHTPVGLQIYTRLIGKAGAQIFRVLDDPTNQILAFSWKNFLGRGTHQHCYEAEFYASVQM